MSETYKAIGNVHHIGDLQTFDSGFTKREFVIEVQDGKYPQMVKFEAVKDKTALLDGLQHRDEIEVSFNLRGNEYNGKYYTNLIAWNIKQLAANPNPDPGEGYRKAAGQSAPATPATPAATAATAADDDIPF